MGAPLTMRHHDRLEVTSQGDLGVKPPEALVATDGNGVQLHDDQRKGGGRPPARPLAQLQLHNGVFWLMELPTTTSITATGGTAAGGTTTGGTTTGGAVAGVASTESTPTPPASSPLTASSVTPSIGGAPIADGPSTRADAARGGLWADAAASGAVAPHGLHGDVAHAAAPDTAAELAVASRGTVESATAGHVGKSSVADRGAAAPVDAAASVDAAAVGAGVDSDSPSLSSASESCASGAARSGSDAVATPVPIDSSLGGATPRQTLSIPQRLRLRLLSTPGCTPLPMGTCFSVGDSTFCL